MIGSLTKLAEDLTDRVDELEKENAGLRVLSRQALEQVKEASAAPAASSEAIEETLDALCKAGALEESQRDDSRRILSEDPDAVHRILRRVLDAQGQAKEASAEEAPDLSGGRLVSAPAKGKEECMDRMMAILGMR